jgi:MSHA pilin protein MshD
MHSPQRERGLTLIELVISIVVVSIAVGAILGVLSRNAEHSADAMVLTQAAAIAEAYMEEIELKPFADPDGVSGETARAQFDDVADYNGLVDAGAVDEFGNAIPSLSRYTVSVDVTPTGALPNVPPADAYRIDVRVQNPPYADVRLTGYKTRW